DGPGKRLAGADATAGVHRREGDAVRYRCRRIIRDGAGDLVAIESEPIWQTVGAVGEGKVVAVIGRQGQVDRCARLTRLIAGVVQVDRGRRDDPGETLAGGNAAARIGCGDRDVQG